MASGRSCNNEAHTRQALLESVSWSQSQPADRSSGSYFHYEWILIGKGGRGPHEFSLIVSLLENLLSTIVDDSQPEVVIFDYHIGEVSPRVPSDTRSISL